MAASSARNIVLKTLGSLELKFEEGEGGPALVHGKRIALFSYLALARPQGFHRRDTLCGLFWSELDQSRARAALRQALHSLRQALGRDAVLNRGPEEIGLDFSVIACDALQFEQVLEQGDAERAVEIYGGPLLHGFYLSETPEFEKWLSIERDRLAQSYADALRSLAEQAAEEGDHASAARWWKRLAVHDPYSPKIALQLMSSLDAAGERAAAIEHARVHAEAVRVDLEMEPDTGVLEYAERLRSEPSHRPVPPVVVPTTPARQAPDVAAEPETRSVDLPKRRDRRMWYWVGVPLTALILLGFYTLIRMDGDVETSSRLSLRILPVENLGSSEDDYFVNGLAEDLASRLAGVQILSVAGPSATSLGSIGYPSSGLSEMSDVDYSLRIAAERVPGPAARRSISILASLTRNEDGLQLWSESIDGGPTSLFELQARLAEAVPRALGIPVLSNERDWLRTSPTVHLIAYDDYLRGTHFLRTGSGEASALSRAIELFESAVTVDSSFVPAYAKLSIAHTLMFSRGGDRSAVRLARAKAAADRALFLRADAPISHLAQGWYYYRADRDYDRAIRHFGIAGASWGGLGDVRLFLGDIRRRKGDLDQALVDYDDASMENPSCATCAAEVAVTYLMRRDFLSAQREASLATSIAPDQLLARQVEAMVRIANGEDVATVIEALPPALFVSSRRLLDLAAGPWGAIPRILGGGYADRLTSLNLSDEIADTVGYYLTKAELSDRLDRPAVSWTYYDSARVILEPRVAELPRDALLRARLGLSYAGLGKGGSAIAEGLEASRLLPISEDRLDGALALEMLARVYAMVGEQDAAVQRLELLLANPTLVSREILSRDPVWISLREHPGFSRLVR